MDSAEHFSVVSRGSLFAAYREVERVPIWSNIGHEFRELAREQIEKVTPLKCPNIGPCPIHPDFVIVVRDDEQEEQGALPKRYLEDNDLFIVVSDPRPTVDLVLDCFFDFGFLWKGFTTWLYRGARPLIPALRWKFTFPKPQKELRNKLLILGTSK